MLWEVVGTSLFFFAFFPLLVCYKLSRAQAYLDAIKKSSLAAVRSRIWVQEGKLAPDAPIVKATEWVMPYLNAELAWTSLSAVDLAVKGLSFVSADNGLKTDQGVLDTTIAERVNNLAECYILNLGRCLQHSSFLAFASYAGLIVILATVIACLSPLLLFRYFFRTTRGLRKKITFPLTLMKQWRFSVLVSLIAFLKMH